MRVGVAYVDVRVNMAQYKRDLDRLQSLTNKAVSNIQSSFNRAGKTFTTLANTSDKASKSIDRVTAATSRHKKSVMSLIPHVAQVTAAYMAMRVAWRGVISGLLSGVQFEQKMSVVKAVTRSTEAEFMKLSEAARQLAKDTVFTATETASALKYLAMAGFNTKESIAALPGVLNLALIGELELGRATDIATDTLRAFGLAAEDINRATDAMVATITRSNTNIEMMGKAMKFAAPVAKTLGYEIEEVSAMIGILSQSGVKSGIAGRNLQQAFVRVQKAAKRMGMEMGSNVIDVLKEYNKRQAELEFTIGKVAAREETLANVRKDFGLISLKSILILKDNIDAYEQLRNKVQDSAGETEDAAKTMQDNVDSAFKRLKSIVAEISISIYDEYKQSIANFLEDTRDWFEKNAEMIKNFAKAAIRELDVLQKTIRMLLKPFTGLYEILKKIGDLFGMDGNLGTKVAEGTLVYFLLRGRIASAIAALVVAFKEGAFWATIFSTATGLIIPIAAIAGVTSLIILLEKFATTAERASEASKDISAGAWWDMNTPPPAVSPSPSDLVANMMNSHSSTGGKMPQIHPTGGSSQTGVLWGFGSDAGGSYELSGSLTAKIERDRAKFAAAEEAVARAAFEKRAIAELSKDPVALAVKKEFEYKKSLEDKYAAELESSGSVVKKMAEAVIDEKMKLYRKDVNANKTALDQIDKQYNKYYQEMLNADSGNYAKQMANLDIWADHAIETYEKEGKDTTKLREVIAWQYKILTDKMMAADDKKAAKDARDAKAELALEQRLAKQKSDAYNRMSEQMLKKDDMYYDLKMKRIDAEAERYFKATNDQVIVDRWRTDQKEKLDRERDLRTNKFFRGMQIGYRQLEEDQYSLAKGGLAIFQEFTSSAESLFSDGLFQVMKGDLSSWGDLWQGFVDSMLRSFVDMIARMVVEWATFQAVAFGVNTFGISIPGMPAAGGGGGIASSALSGYGAYSLLGGGGAAAAATPLISGSMAGYGGYMGLGIGNPASYTAGASMAGTGVGTAGFGFGMPAWASTLGLAALPLTLPAFAASGGAEWLSDTAGNIFDSVTDVVSGVGDVVSDVVGGVGDFIGGVFGFHSGGVITAHKGMFLAPDERMIRAQTGEAILNREATEAIGGKEGVDTLNAGGAVGGGANITFVNQGVVTTDDVESWMADMISNLNRKRVGDPIKINEVINAGIDL
jgi:TP901 family phage tail tape measure protein